jgi:hypothetical protein
MKKRKREEYERWKGFGYMIGEKEGSEGYSQIK